MYLLNSGCFHLLTGVNNDTTNTDVQIFVEQKYTNTDATEMSVMKDIHFFMCDCIIFDLFIALDPNPLHLDS